MKILLDFFPILLFFGAYKFYGIYVGTAVLMAATVVQMATIYAIDLKLQTMHKVTLALVLLFGCGMIWFGILVGSWLRSVEAVNGFLFSTLFPLSFLSNAFVPTEPMPDVLEVIAEWNPMSALVVGGAAGDLPPVRAASLQPPHRRLSRRGDQLAVISWR